ncbi:hypothetical protein RFI_06114 [Reticulomyxa filosa]|uniref:25S rRNA (uridine-N(3))-methyltransferase BMT5-like domain-containing protein n=1 Tax=Reticulomyxa filosa TaxID=46433 RepID=X6NXH0_RETFI|nr:hypothetical protein RFI_06114 [Reticulomyxa filosa]|eukprot:ETO31005.1 hypothetical protein RFI_06114 [Reticulomyxa filosa]
MIAQAFRAMLISNENELIHTSFGWSNMCKTPEERDDICIEWIKSELLYQYSRVVYGRACERHRRACALVHSLFNPLTYEASREKTQRFLRKVVNLYEGFQIALSSLPKLTADQPEAERFQNAFTFMGVLWSELRMALKTYQDHNSTEYQRITQSIQTFIKQQTPDLYDQITTIDCEDIFRAFRTCLIHQLHDLANFDEHLDEIISLFARAHVFHILVGLIRMEPGISAAAKETRNACRQSINAMFCVMNERMRNLLEHSQLPVSHFTENDHYKLDYMDGTSNGNGDPFFAELRHAGHYRNNQTILVIGDGNLSFGRALCRKFGAWNCMKNLEARKRSVMGGFPSLLECGARNVLVTCYETAMELLHRYPHSISVVTEIEERGGMVLYGVDATNIPDTLGKSFHFHGLDRRPYKLFEGTEIRSFRWDLIVWNFPHAMNENMNPEVNGKLVEDFLKSCFTILAASGEIHVTLHLDNYKGHSFHYQKKKKKKGVFFILIFE